MRLCLVFFESPDDAIARVEHVDDGFVVDLRHSHVGVSFDAKGKDRHTDEEHGDDGDDLDEED